jgi:hypothetical protein
VFFVHFFSLIITHYAGLQSTLDGEVRSVVDDLLVDSSLWEFGSVRENIDGV